MDFIFERYDLELKDFDGCCYTVLHPLARQNTEALKKERRKLYIIHDGQNILYVGEANSSLKTRFQRGTTVFNYSVRKNESRNGYRGYKWLNSSLNSQRRLRVSAIVFSEAYDDNRNIVEAIEGELVYLIRNATGRWPECQNEIHFSNKEDAKEAAKTIYELIASKKT